MSGGSSRRRTTRPCSRSATRSAPGSLITDGEMRRESYSNRSANALAGIDLDRPGEIVSRAGLPTPCRASSGRSCASTRARARRRVPAREHGQAREGDRARPFTMSQQAQDDSTETEGAGARLRRRRAARKSRISSVPGADVVQLDEPWLQARPSRPRVRRRGAESRARAAPAPWPCTCASATPRSCTSGLPATRSYPSSRDRRRADLDRDAQASLDTSVLESLAPKTIIVGVLDLGTTEVESPRPSRSGSAAR